MAPRGVLEVRAHWSHETFFQGDQYESFGSGLKKIGAKDILALMGKLGTLDPPGKVKEGSDKVGAIYTFDQWVKVYDPGKNQPFLTEW